MPQLNAAVEMLPVGIRYVFRMLAKSPAVTLVAVVSLALAIGANTAIFSIINALFLRMLPVRDPHELVAISTGSEDGQVRNEPLPLATFVEVRKNQRAFSEVFAWAGDYKMTSFEVDGVRYAGTLDTVSGEFYSTLGIQPLVGRLITPDDVALPPGASARVAVLDYRCWLARHDGDPAVIGKIIHVDGIPHTIIGVTPKAFSGLFVDVAPDVTVPIGYSGRRVAVMGRLKPGTTLEQARADLRTLAPEALAAGVPPEFDAKRRANFLVRRIEAEPAATGNAAMRERLSRPLAVVMGLVGIVLLIACVNLANLMRARAAARRRELGIRVALGAGGWPLISLPLAESVTLTMAGAALGLTVAGWTSRLLLNTVWTGYVPHTLDTSLDLRVLAFATAIALMTGVLSGLAPGMSALRTDPASVLRQGGRTVSGGARTFGKLLVSGQVALSLVLVLGALLLVRSLINLRTRDSGFRRQGVLIVHLFPQPGRERIPNRITYYRQLADKLSELPGVESVSFSNKGPATRFELAEPVTAPSSPGLTIQAVRDWVGPGFFRLMGVRVLEGREFEWRDDERAPRVAIVSESLARRLFPASGAIGRRIGVDEGRSHREFEIVGVVSSASLWNVRSREPMAVYGALMQEAAFNQLMLDIRAATDPWSLAPPVRQVLEAQGHHYPLRIETTEERVDRSLTDERAIAMLSASLGGLALLLASLGLYGVVSYSVTRRTPEIGIRMALGAQRANALRLILREVMSMVLAGLAIGIPVAFAASRLMSGMLFGLSEADPALFVLAVALLLGVALFAGYLPARRASRIDPVVALRCE